MNLSKPVNAPNYPLEIIEQLTKKLRGVRDIETVINNSIEVMQKYEGTPVSGIYRFDKIAASVQLLKIKKTGKKVSRVLSAIPFSESISSHTINTRKLFISENIHSDKRIHVNTKAILKESGFNSIISIPLMCKEEIYGTMDLFFLSPIQLSPEKTKLFTILGNIISSAIANVNLVSALESEVKQWNKILLAMEGANIGLMEWHIAEDSIYLNNTCSVILGYDNQSRLLSAGEWNELVHPDDRPLLMAGIHSCIDGQEKLLETEFRLHGTQENWKWILLRGRITQCNDCGAPDLLVATLLDITRRKQAEMSLVESEEKFRTFTEFSPIPMMIYQDDKWIYANPAAVKITGYSIEELMNMHFWEFVHPDYQELIKKRGQSRQQGESPISHYEFKIVQKSGREVWVDFWAQPITYQKRIAVLIAAIDITQRKNFELKQKNLELQLEHSQRLEAIGRLAGGVAHDFNNLLSPIMGYAELLITERSDDVSLKRRLQEIVKAAESAKTLTGHLLAFSRKQFLEQKIINLNSLLDNFLQILKRTIRENIKIRVVPHRSMWNIKADSGQIEQILMNMAINAQDALPEGGDLIIETTNVSLDAVYSDDHPRIEPGEYVLLTISDTGTGIDRETIENIFEPFFTTKEHGKGTGLGLSTVYGIVRQHNGHIHVYSEPGKGTSFKIYFPRERAEADGKKHSGDDSEILAGTETILLVEDEPMVREMTARALQSAGYSVIEASSAEEALKKASLYKGDLDLLLTDIIMQDMNGVDLYQRIIYSRPDLKVLYMSGYTTELLGAFELAVSSENYIQKPFSIKNLSRSIRNILG